MVDRMWVPIARSTYKGAGIRKLWQPAFLAALRWEAVLM